MEETFFETMVLEEAFFLLSLFYCDALQWELWENQTQCTPRLFPTIQTGFELQSGLGIELMCCNEISSGFLSVHTNTIRKKV